MVAREIRAVDFGFYERIDLDDAGLPTFGKPLAKGVIPAELEEFEAYVRFAGDPGLYRLTISIRSAGREFDVAMDWDDALVAIPVGGDAHYVIPVPGRRVPPEGLPDGAYAITIAREGETLITFGFTISELY